MNVAVVGIASLALTIVFTIIMLLKVKTNSTVTALGSSAINDTVDNSVTAIQEPVAWFALVIIFLVLAGVGAFLFGALKNKQY